MPKPQPKPSDPIAQSALKKLCDFYRFHRICPDAYCRRARECRGDSEACFHHWWEYFPEDAKIRFRVSIRESCKGASRQEAALKAEAAVAMYLQEQERQRARAGQNAGAAPPARREPPQPRVRLG